MSDKRRAWLELRLLCRRGVGIPSIAPELCRLIRRIIPADAGAVAWLDDTGMPIGFFQEHQPREVKELFANEYQQLFMGPGEFGVAWMLAQRGRTIGNWLAAPSREVEMSNTYNLYMRPLSHRHLIEARIEVEGRPRALFTFYREARWPYTEEDVAEFRLIEPLLQRAATPDATVIWADTTQEEHLLVDASGRRLLSASLGAQAMLQEATLIGQGVSLVATMVEPPRFVADLRRQLAAGDTAAVTLPAVSGMLGATAHPLRGIAAGRLPGEDQVLVTLTLARPSSMAVLQRIIDLNLSPLRSEIAHYAVTGGRRPDVPRTFGISKEALKKHLREIYHATGAREWDELPAALGVAGAAGRLPN